MKKLSSLFVSFVLILCFFAIIPFSSFNFSSSFSQSYLSFVNFFDGIGSGVSNTYNRVTKFLGIDSHTPIDTVVYERSTNSYLPAVSDPVLQSYLDSSTFAIYVSFNSKRFSGNHDETFTTYQWLIDMRYNGECYFLFDEHGTYTCTYYYCKELGSYIFVRNDYFTLSYYNPHLSSAKIIMTSLDYVRPNPTPLTYNGDYTITSVIKGFTFIKG